MTDIRFVVLGRPQQKGSKRIDRAPNSRLGYVMRDANPKARPWANLITAAARDAYRDELLRGAVEVELGFYFARPKAHMGTGKNAGSVLASAPRHMIVMPDVDKLARAACDALTGVVFKDDSQIALLLARKGYGEPERLEAVVRDLERA